MSYSTDFETTPDSQYLVSLESRRRDETEFSEEDIPAEYECEPEQEETDNKSSEDEQNSSSNIALPGLPEFELMQNTRGLSKSHVTLPSDLQLGSIKSLTLFELFFSNTLLQTIVENTNNYEQIKGSEGGRSWKPLTLNELKIWFALYMSLFRFQQIKRFLHISSINEPHLYWYSKVEPLASHIREMSKKLYVPCSQVSVDEMIARFSGRSAHTVRMKNKPTPEGYKILSLCDAGYIYTFIFTSRVEKNTDIEPVVGLNETGRLVWHLVKQLPHTKTFH
ncbi:16797_t:CDS:2, partial [Acaulospora morrowiae]